MGRNRRGKNRGKKGKAPAGEQHVAAAAATAATPPTTSSPKRKRPRDNHERGAEEGGAKASKKRSTDGKAHGKRSLTSLQSKMQAQLEGARFRTLNEELYTSKGQDAFQRFSKEPALFDVYHRGFREMAKEWPENPLDSIITWLNTRHPGAVVADFGCGDAQLAARVKKNVVHSFDLVSVNPRVTACDMASVPLPDDSVDVAVFCLSLMGTNLVDYIREARRVLKPSTGVMKIVEVRSRFEGADSGGLPALVKSINQLGFDCTQQHQKHSKMFAMLEFKKRGGADEAGDDEVEIAAKPCIYKRR